ncbi:MAG: GNAT family N-acetyltransferase [Spirochaetales bacterium]|nr:GNAT family N-acetyltransferase [Spirochaetales bacterium]
MSQYIILENSEFKLLIEYYDKNKKEHAMNITCRRAVITDAESISRIWEAVCAERVYTVINNPFTPEQERDYITSLSAREGIFVAEVENRIIAFQSLDTWVKFTDSFDHAGTIGTYLLPRWRRKGIGRKLAQHTIGFARDHGYEKLIIYVRASNTGAQNFYKSLGFVPKGILTKQVKIDGQYDDEVFMELFL